MSEYVPWVDSLGEVYGSGPGSEVPPECEQRFKTLINTFAELYGQKPDFVSRSPGRVNIIGEHVDYSLYNVLPTAITNDVVIAVQVAKADGDEKTEQRKLTISNLNPTKYPTQEYLIPPSGAITVDNNDHKWSNYFLAGVSGAVDFLRRKHDEEGGRRLTPRGMKVLVHGSVPPGGGLSSSAAFVCASALAAFVANGQTAVSKQDLLDECIVSERSVGVFSGGMDQAASIFSQPGFLLYCRFWPQFSAEHVPLPQPRAGAHSNDDDDNTEEFTFLIAQSFITSDKAITAPIHYNLRVVEVTLAALTSYTRADIAAILEISIHTLETRYLSQFPIRAASFKLRQRALHVLQEAHRVLEFRRILSESLGELMNQTQLSCREVFECSCPEVDDICAIARTAGAYGSRLTGAGWGGCTVHLLPQTAVGAVVSALKEQYYFKKFPNISNETLSEAIVTSKPGQGSSLIHGKALDL
ncbi:hypothetical protein DV735_g308, partial [Chaetothyriales sp. CBS 134920]